MDDDLLDEATQQHNCVASYAQSIAEGRSLIYVMREKKAPEKSLITIELTPKTHKIRQKLLAYNCPIRNKAQTEFIERWHKHVLECV
ncbi:PcfJ domain-containing protein [Ruminococcus albus]|uniref:PcfJ domain-containing protein n=1 Tax=Ruminococcus albus TaxID=1264 RepID=UPI0009B8C685|nr:PcfJ domain-containing protein [Ruminococcus albus]